MKRFQIDCLYCLLALEDTCQKSLKVNRVVSCLLKYNTIFSMFWRSVHVSFPWVSDRESKSDRYEWNSLIFFCDSMSYWVSIDYDTMIWWKRGWKSGKQYIFRLQSSTLERTCEHIRNLYDSSACEKRATKKLEKLHNLSLKPRTKHSSRRTGKVFDLFHAIHSFLPLDDWHPEKLVCCLLLLLHNNAYSFRFVEKLYMCILLWGSLDVSVV